jgi:hypothetical protein
VDTSRSQRWRDRRGTWTSDQTVIDPKAYAVERIDHADARAFIARHHYLPNYPAAQIAVGLFGRRAALEGVAVFARPAIDAVITAHTGFDDAARGTVLARLLLLDTVPQNGESFFVARAFRTLRAARPGIEAVVSYSDPEAGHVGQVYAALSGAYRGRTRPRGVLSVAGVTIAGRTLSKIRSGDSGSAGAIDQLVRRGAPPPRAFEEPHAWLKRLEQAGVLVRRTQGALHCYCFELTRAARRQGDDLPRLAYPKLGGSLAGRPAPRPHADLTNFTNLTNYASIARSAS